MLHLSHVYRRTFGLPVSVACLCTCKPMTDSAQSLGSYSPKVRVPFLVSLMFSLRPGREGARDVIESTKSESKSEPEFSGSECERPRPQGPRPSTEGPGLQVRVLGLTAQIWVKSKCSWTSAFTIYATERELRSCWRRVKRYCVAVATRVPRHLAQISGRCLSHVSLPGCRRRSACCVDTYLYDGVTPPYVICPPARWQEASTNGEFCSHEFRPL